MLGACRLLGCWFYRCGIMQKCSRLGGASGTPLAKACEEQPQARADRWRTADFPVCCIAGFLTRRQFVNRTRQTSERPADWEIGDTAGWETCGTPVPVAHLKPGAPADSGLCWQVFISRHHHTICGIKCPGHRSEPHPGHSLNRAVGQEDVPLSAMTVFGPRDGV